MNYTKMGYFLPWRDSLVILVPKTNGGGLRPIALVSFLKDLGENYIPQIGVVR